MGGRRGQVHSSLHLPFEDALILRVPIVVEQTGTGIKATLRGLEEVEERARKSVATLAAEPGEQTPGERLEASHRRLVERIRERERKEQG